MADRLSLVEIEIKKLEDTVALLREAFEQGIVNRNAGSRVNELLCWGRVRRFTGDASDQVAAIRGLL